MVKRFELINIVKNKLNLKREECKYINDPLISRKINAIEKMLTNERCFFEIQRGVAMEILSFLGFTDEQATNLYDELTDINNFKGDFTFKT